MTTPADPKLIEAQWEQFQESALSTIEPPLSPEEVQLARACFYFGAMGLLGFLESDQANGGRRHMKLAIEQLNREIDDFSAANPQLKH
jgi:hypothetical protein